MGWNEGNEFHEFWNGELCCPNGIWHTVCHIHYETEMFCKGEEWEKAWVVPSFYKTFMYERVQTDVGYYLGPKE